MVSPIGPTDRGAVAPRAAREATHTMSYDQLPRWAELVDRLAGPNRPKAQQMADGTDVPPPALVRPARRDRREGDVILWSGLAAGRDSPSALEAAGLELDADGPLWATDDWTAIEVWTEAELSGLHALWRLLRQGGIERAALRGRIRRAAAWHVEHTQPDNATGRPWAAHVFLIEGLISGWPDARAYAETLLHNAGVHRDERGETSWILSDVARELRLADAAFLEAGQERTL